MIATIAALLLTVAGILHSYCFMCRKLPAARVRSYYPASFNLQVLLNLCWIALALTGFLLTYSLSPTLGLLSVAIYFLLLPLLLQPFLSRLLGFRNLVEYVEMVDRQKSTKD